ncbi:hypothetical protein CONPUDRAFT_159462 [Coniophora puteana RWD-64-598 SS2]|uniref:Uncharacterized protein n=1 Tax=Coniophora puteana (strain RWD-64-598) TaxID=741705 RepID=A0A5M3M8H1_CONPW|nr:uncharacterized protein CONPUDRAFT_159462 [Coniophora puteana RWD-64-598 SS2]EIW75337.1 hypothetical protein CONPUDRAFT_159462 [Coniophora puteana RWD-64-598 SS2]
MYQEPPYTQIDWHAEAEGLHEALERIGQERDQALRQRDAEASRADGLQQCLSAMTQALASGNVSPAVPPTEAPAGGASASAPAPQSQQLPPLPELSEGMDSISLLDYANPFTRLTFDDYKAVEDSWTKASWEKAESVHREKAALLHDPKMNKQGRARQLSGINVNELFLMNKMGEPINGLQQKETHEAIQGIFELLLGEVKTEGCWNSVDEEWEKTLANA